MIDMMHARNDNEVIASLISVLFRMFRNDALSRKIISCPSRGLRFLLGTGKGFVRARASIYQESF